MVCVRKPFCGVWVGDDTGEVAAVVGAVVVWREEREMPLQVENKVI